MAVITGSIEEIDNERHLVLTRTFDATVEDVWQSLTDSAKLTAWIGHWVGDPTTGTVEFFMTAEGEDVGSQTVSIDECAAPRRFACHFASGDFPWHVWFTVEEIPTGVRLRFGHLMDDSSDLGEIGPGWEYYLDRLVAARAGTSVDAIEWHHYFPTLASAYRALGLV